MANEITVTAQLAATNGNLIRSMAPIAYNVTQNNAYATSPGQNIGTSEETVGFGDVGTEGWFMMKNEDATNYVEWGFSTGVYGGRMKAGETAGPFRMNPGGAIFAKANTAACEVSILLLDD